MIDTTRSHLFWDPAARRWVKAAALRYGTRLRAPAGSGTATVLGGRNPKVTTGWMWDLTVPGNNDHDFYVKAATTAVLVHNCDTDTPRFAVNSNGVATDLHADMSRAGMPFDRAGKLEVWPQGQWLA